MQHVCTLTFDCDVLRCFHFGVVNERAFVFSGGVTGDICDGVRVCILHFHCPSLQRQSSSGSWLVYDALLMKCDIIQMQSWKIFLSIPRTFRWKLKLVGAGLPSATHFRVTLSPSIRGSWEMTWRAMFSVESAKKRQGRRKSGRESGLSEADAPNR